MGARRADVQRRRDMPDPTVAPPGKRGSVYGFVSYGCFRMLNQDVPDLYGRVCVGASVVVGR